MNDKNDIKSLETKTGKPLFSNFFSAAILIYICNKIFRNEKYSLHREAPGA